MVDKPATKVNMTWQGGFKFVSEDAYGHSVVVDAPENEGEAFDGMMPAGYLLTSLAGCSGIDVVNILTRQRQSVTGIEVQVVGKQQPDPPWVTDEVEVVYTIRGQALNEQSVKRAIELSEERYCFVGATLKGNTTITSTYKIIEE